MKPFYTRFGAALLLTVVGVLLLTPLVALAQDVTESVTNDPVTALVITLLEKVMSGDWAAVASAAIALVVYVSRLKKSPLQKIFLKLSFGKWDIKSDRGGALLVLLLGLAGGLVTTLTAGAPISVALLVTCLKESVMAAGGYVLVKKIFFPTDEVENPKTASDAAVAVAKADAAAAAVTPPTDISNDPMNR